MATNPFDDFLRRTVGDLTAGVGRAASPVAPATSPMPAPAQRAAIQQASAGLPPDLVALIGHAAQQAAVQVPPRPQPPLDMTPYIQAAGGADRIASTTPVAGPPPSAATQPAPQEPYVPVMYNAGAGEQLILVPASRAKNLPVGARIAGDGTPIADPAMIERARAQGATLELQPAEVQAAFRTSEEQYAVSQQRAQAEGMQPALSTGAMTPSGVAERTPDQAQDVARAYGPQTTGKPPQPGQAGYTPTGTQAPTESEPVVTVTTQQLLSSGDPEMAKLGADLEANGITSIRSDQVLMIDPQTGRKYLATPEEIVQQDRPIAVEDFAAGDPELAKRLTDAGITSIRPSDVVAEGPDGQVMVLSKEQAARLAEREPVGTQLPALTTTSLRQWNAAAANQLEAQGIHEIPDGQMVVRAGDGSLQLVPNATTAPAGTEIVVYGGQSSQPVKRLLAPEDTDEWSDIFKTPLKLAAAPVATALTALEPLDKPRQFNVTQQGERAYEWAKANPDGGNAAQIASLRATGLGDPATDFRLWMLENPAAVIEAYEQGYTSPDGKRFTGGRAVWEWYSADQPRIQRIANDLAADPLNWLAPLGGVARGAGVGVLGTGAETTLGRRVLGEALGGVGRAAQTPDRVMDAVTAEILRPVGNAVRAVPGVGWLTSPSKRQRLSNLTRPVMESLNDVMARQGAAPLGQQALGPAMPGAGVPPSPGSTPGLLPNLTPEQTARMTPEQVRLYRAEQRRRAETGLQTALGTEPEPTAIVVPGQRAGEVEIIAPDGRTLTGDPAEVFVVDEQGRVLVRAEVTSVEPRRTDPLRPSEVAAQQQDVQARLDAVLGGQPAAGTGLMLPTTQRNVREPLTSPEIPAAAAMEPTPSPASTIPPQAPAMPQQTASDPFAGTPLGEAIAAPMADNERPWGWLSPTETSTPETGRIIDQLWQARRQHEQEWRTFFQIHDAKARQYQRRLAALDDIEWRQQIRDPQTGRMGYRYPYGARDMYAAVEDAEYVIDGLIPDMQRAYRGTEMQPAYRFRWERQEGKGLHQQSDAYLIEQYIFGESQARAEEIARVIESRIRNGNTVLESLWTREGNAIPELRRKYEALRQGYGLLAGAPARSGGTTLPDGFAAPLTNVGMLPMDRVRVTVGMDDAQLQALGLPPLQFRRRPFSEQTAQDIATNFQPNDFEPIKVARGTDGNFYIVSGHSRYEGFRRRGEQAIPAQLIEGTPDELAQTARRSNAVRTGYSVLETAHYVRDRIAQGKSLEAIARELREGNEDFAKAGTSAVRDYLGITYLPEASRTMDYLAQGVIPPRIAGMIGNGIQTGAVTLDQADNIAFRIMRGDWNEAQVRSAITTLGQDKANALVSQAADELGDTTLADRITRLDFLRKEQGRLEREIRRYRSIGKRDGLTSRQTASLRDLETQLVEVKAERASIAEPQYVPIDDTPAVEAPTPEASAAPAVTPEDVTPDQAMRTNPSAQALFASADAQARANAERWAENTRATYDRTLGRSVRNPNAAPAPRSESVRVDDTPLDVARLRGRVLGVHERRSLLQSFADNGETIAARWDRYATELEQNGIGTGKRWRTLTTAEAEREAAARVLNDWAAEKLREVDPRKYAIFEEERERLMTKARQPVKDPAAASAQALDVALRGGKRGTTALDVYDTTLAVLREGALYNVLTGPRYVLTQAIGNTITALLTGHADIVRTAFTPRNYRAALDELRHGGRDVADLLTPMTGDDFRRGLAELGEQPHAILHDDADMMLAELGLANVREDISTQIRDETTQVGKRLRTRDVADNLRLGRMRVPIAGQASSLWANQHVRDLANAFDLSFRKALYAHTMQANIAEVRDAFFQHMREQLPRWKDGTPKVDEARFDALWQEMPQVFGSDRIRLVFADLDATWADRMARDWQSTIGRMDANAREEVRRVFFSGDETNGDAILRRVVFFHYWMSRATPLYVSSLARNPGLLNAYLNMMDDMRQQAASGRYGKAVEGLLFVMSTPLGWNIFIRPDAFFQTVLSFGASSDYAPESETGLGAFMRKTGLFFNPIIDTMANLSGAQGDTFAPDPLMLGQWSNLVTRALDLGKAHGFLPGEGPTANRLTDMWVQLRSHTSGHLPGTEPIPYRDSTMFARRDINELIYDVAEEQRLATDDPRVLAAMDDPSSPLYQEAFRRYADARGVEQLARILPTSVLYPKFRPARADERNARMADLPMGDPERDRLQDEKSMAAIADPRARELRRQQGEYYTLGTDDQRATYDTYNQIRYGELATPVRINGVMVRERQLASLSSDQRQLAADQWATENGKTADVAAVQEARRSYRDTHPEYAAYTAWASDVRDYAGGPLGFWEDLARGNPNAARWFHALEPMPADDLDQKLTSVEAYMAFAGVQPTVYDPAPIAVNDPASIPYNPAGTGAGGPRWTPKDPAQKIADDLVKYQQDVALYNQQVASVIGQPINMDGLNPMARAAYDRNMRGIGITPPSLSADARAYFEWQAAQPAGADTSIAAFLRWRASFTNGTGGNVLDPASVLAMPAS